jgi:hypothetical protein
LRSGFVVTRIRTDDRHNWALCNPPDGRKDLPHLFITKDAARVYLDEVLAPAVISERLRPPRVEHDLKDMQGRGLPDAVGPVCPIAIRTLRKVALRKSLRRDSAGNQWIVLEREDGKEWGEPTDEKGVGINGGIGAFRKIEEPIDLRWFEIVDGQKRSIRPPFPPGYRREKRRSDQPDLSILPIAWLADLEGKPYDGQRFREYFPAGDTFELMGPSSMDRLQKELAEVLRKEYPDSSCDLGDDWHFDQIQGEAMSLPSCNFRDGRRIDNLTHQLALIAHDLEDVLLIHHKALCADAVASFWTSWTVWNYIAAWAGACQAV